MEQLLFTLGYQYPRWWEGLEGSFRSGVMDFCSPSHICCSSYLQWLRTESRVWVILWLTTPVDHRWLPPGGFGNSVPSLQQVGYFLDYGELFDFTSVGSSLSLVQISAWVILTFSERRDVRMRVEGVNPIFTILFLFFMWCLLTEEQSRGTISWGIVWKGLWET